VLVRVEGKSLSISPTHENIIERWARLAKEQKVDTSKWIMGDDLYEEAF
jgi:hypothetical protein